MRMLSKILGACAIAALAGSAAWAANTPVQHHLTVWLPGGGSEEITYTGNVAPKLSFTPSDFAPAPVAFWSPFAMDTTMWAPMDRAMAAMDRAMAPLVRQADAMMAMPFNDVANADLRAMPPGAQSYSVISTMSGNNVCTRSVEITREGNGHAPKVVRHSSGNCAASPDGSVLFQTLPSHDDHLIKVETMEAFPARPAPHI